MAAPPKKASATRQTPTTKSDSSPKTLTGRNNEALSRERDIAQDRLGKALIGIALKQRCSDGEAAKKSEWTIKKLKGSVLDKHNEAVKWRRYARFVEVGTDQKAREEANAEVMMRLYLAEGASSEKLAALSSRDFLFSPVQQRAKAIHAGARRKSRKNRIEECAIDLSTKIDKAGWLPPPSNKRGRRKGWTKQQAKALAGADKILLNVADCTVAATAFLNVKDIVAIAAVCIKEHAGDLMDFTRPVRRAEKGQTDTAYLAWGTAVEMLRPESHADVIVREMRAYRNTYLLSDPQNTDIIFKFTDHTS